MLQLGAGGLLLLGPNGLLTTDANCCCGGGGGGPAVCVDTMFPILPGDVMQATFTGVAKASFGIFANALTLVDPDGRVYCMRSGLDPFGHPNWGFYGYDWTPANGTYTLPFTGGGPIYNWARNGCATDLLFNYKIWPLPGGFVSGSYTLVSRTDHRLLLGVTAQCNGDGTVNLGASLNTCEPFNNIQVARWTKTVTVPFGQRLSNLGAINMDIVIVPVTVSGSGTFGSIGCRYPFQGPTGAQPQQCLPAAGALPVETPTLVIQAF